MDKFSLRLEGIYDHRTFKFLKGLGLSHFSFDFRPLGLNFFPQHRFLELLKNEYDHSHHYFLHYKDEKDFIIQKMLDDLLDFRETQGFLFSNFTLEFSDVQSREFYDQFKVPYFWYYQEGRGIKEILRGEYLKGIIMPFSLLEGLFQKGGLDSFIRTFFQLIHGSFEGKALEIILTADWNNNIIPNLFNHFDFHCLSLPINQSIEVCYRNVDLEKLKKNLSLLQKNLGPQLSWI